MSKILWALAISSLLNVAPAQSQESLRIVSWNTNATLLESINDRSKQFESLNLALAPDVLVLIEVPGRDVAEAIAKSLKWQNYHAVVSDFSKVRANAYEGLELAVISKIVIERAVEFDPVPDGKHDAFGAGDLGGNTPSVTEQKITNTALPSLGSFDEYDRGTIRVDLANGLTIFPVHLKSNVNGSCIEIDEAGSAIRTQDRELSEKLKAYFDNGFRKATDQHLKNAQRRERMMAAVLVEANKAVAEGRTVIIAGDFNTAFEPGKAGKLNDDCTLQDFSCAKAPFPKRACRGDGFDDTLAMSEEPLIGTQKWKFLTRNLTRTYNDQKFSDLAIDHIVVPANQSSMFAPATKSDDTFGSDHFAVITEFRQP
jgi:exonuclease III